MRAIEQPNLPEGRVSVLMIGERYRARLEAPLRARGIAVLCAPDNPLVDPRLAGHVDLSAIHTGGRNVVVCVAPDLVNILTNIGCEVMASKDGQAADYPGDCALNGCFIGRRFIHKRGVTDSRVLEFVHDADYISVKQAYAKCSVCVVDEQSLITADAGIYKAALGRGIDALLISPGHVELAGFSYGFIGGGTFKLSKNELAFTGRLNGHPDEGRIMNFLNSKRIAPVFLTDNPVFDIGSAILFFEA